MVHCKHRPTVAGAVSCQHSQANADLHTPRAIQKTSSPFALQPVLNIFSHPQCDHMCISQREGEHAPITLLIHAIHSPFNIFLNTLNGTHSVNA